MDDILPSTIQWLLTRYPGYLKRPEGSPSQASSSPSKASAAQPETSNLEGSQSKRPNFVGLHFINFGDDNVKMSEWKFKSDHESDTGAGTRIKSKEKEVERSLSKMIELAEENKIIPDAGLSKMMESAEECQAVVDAATPKYLCDSLQKVPAPSNKSSAKRSISPPLDHALDQRASILKHQKPGASHLRNEMHESPADDDRQTSNHDVGHSKQYLEKKALEEKALEEKALMEKALEQKALEEKALMEKALEQKALEEKALMEKALKEKILEEKALKEKALKEKAQEEIILKEIILKEKILKEKILEEKALKKKALKKKALKEKTPKEKARMETVRARVADIRMKRRKKEAEANKARVEHLQALHQHYTAVCSDMRAGFLNTDQSVAVLTAVTEKVTDFEEESILELVGGSVMGMLVERQKRMARADGVADELLFRRDTC